MKELTAQRIRLMYECIEESEPDISTERLLQMTADNINSEEGLHIDVSDVVDALDYR